MFDDPIAGLYHLLIFYGFLVVSLRTVTMVIEGLFAGWELPFLNTPVGHAYLFSKDIFELLVLVGLGFAIWRRGIQKKERVVQSFGAWLARETGWERVRDVGYPTPGSLGTWCAERGIHLVTVELSPAGVEDLVRRHLDTMVRLLAGDAPGFEA